MGGGVEEQNTDAQRGTTPGDSASAFLTLAALLCGFAFAGLVMYLGTSSVSAARIVAASLLLAAFVSLLLCSFSMCLIIYKPGLLDLLWWYIVGRLTLVAGGLLLLASVCVMSFAWAHSLGWVSVVLAALSVAAVAGEARRG